MLAAVLSGLAACGGTAPQAGDAEAGNDVRAVDALPAARTAVADNSTGAVDENQVARPLEAGDVDAYVRGMTRETELLQASYDKAAQAREKGDVQAETAALMEMTSPDVDAAGARAAGLDLARYGFVKNAVDTVQGKLDLLQGLETGGGGDTEALMDLLGDPYDGLSGDVRDAMQSRRADVAKLRSDALGLRLKAVNG